MSKTVETGHRKSVAVVGPRNGAAQITQELHRHPFTKGSFDTVSLGDIGIDELRVLLETEPGYAAILFLKHTPFDPEFALTIEELQLHTITASVNDPQNTANLLAESLN
jgi:hypothetical protein